MTGLIILAAGESSRLGQPKQNLKFEGLTLLERAVEAGRGSACNKTVIVIGANANKISPIPGTSIFYNRDWITGMASSIRTGMLEFNSDPAIDKVIIMLCDQPFVDAVLLDNLINKQAETNKPIVAAVYNGTTGVPVLFGRSLFSELLSLNGTEGAKTILRTHTDDIAVVPFEKGSIDIDTPQDYERLRGLND